MRYRGIVGNDVATSAIDLQRSSRMSTRFVVFLAFMALLTLMYVPEWNESIVVLDDLKRAPEVIQGIEGEDFPIEVDYSPPTQSPTQRETSSLIARISSRMRPICPRSSGHVVLLFPHVNKAGGRTIEGTFDSPNNPKPQFRPLSRERRSKRLRFSLVNGHRDFDEIQNFMDGQDTRGMCLRWIFMIREPISRTLSAFNTNVGRSDPTVPSKLTNHFYCESEQIKRLMRNASFTFEDFARLPAEDRRTCQRNYHVRYLAGRNGGLEKAKNRIMRMAFVGLAEDFALSMQLLNWELDLDLDLYTPVFNKNLYGKDEEPSEIAKQVLLELNSLDIELYQFAKKIFDTRIRAMREYYGGVFPWQDENIAECDQSIHCWDKRMKWTNDTWDFNDEPPPSARLEDPGEKKENILCAPRTGCKLFQPEKASVVHNATNAVVLQTISQSQCLASVFIVGARKGGTTSLYLYLAEHPNFRAILLDRGAQSGETFFFESRSSPYGDERAPSPQKLRELYDNLYIQEFRRMGLPEKLDKEKFLTGESSVGMGPSCYAPRVLRETCGPKVKVVYLLRDPIARMISQYEMRARLKRVEVESNFTADAQKQLRAVRNHPLMKDLNEWLTSDDILRTAPPCLYTNDFTNSVWSGLYIVHIARWFRQFDKSDLMIVQSETFFKQPGEVFRATLEHVGLNSSLIDIEAATEKVFNAAPSSKKEKLIDEEEKELLEELRRFFEPFNKKLVEWLQERQIAFNLDLWKE